MNKSADRIVPGIGGRRRFLKQLAAMGALTASGAWASAPPPTPRQTAGPFYPAELPLDDDNDLVHVAGQQQTAQGQITDLGGRLLDRNGRPLRNTRIEIWQCDANGRYRHPMDPGRQAEDPGFQGFGHTLSDAEGRYRFLTIKPVPYPGRTPHVHVAVYPEWDPPFVTQLYVEGEPRNGQDFLYQRLAEENRHLVTVPFRKSVGAHFDFQAQWDIVLGVSEA
jgi:protocatechuate 3,4-dioxygenase beta subunit